MSQKSDVDQFREETEEKQHATTWPEALRGGRSVDELLWKGDPKAPLIQRAGLLVFALMYLSMFAVSIAIVIAKRDWTVTLVCLIPGTLAGTVGFRFLRNAFRHNQHNRNRP